jgi:hypothetical protein
MELLIIDDEDMVNAIGYKMYIEHLISFFGTAYLKSKDYLKS